MSTSAPGTQHILVLQPETLLERVIARFLLIGNVAFGEELVTISAALALPRRPKPALSFSKLASAAFV